MGWLEITIKRYLVQWKYLLKKVYWKVIYLIFISSLAGTIYILHCIFTLVKLYNIAFSYINQLNLLSFTYKNITKQYKSNKNKFLFQYYIYLQLTKKKCIKSENWKQEEKIVTI